MKPVISAVALAATAPSAFAKGENAGGMSSLWQVLESGGPVMYPIAALSVLALMLILVYLFSMRRGSVVGGSYMQTADALLKKHDHAGLLSISNRHGEAVAGVMARALDFLTKNPGSGIAEVREIAQAEGIRLAGLWNQRISYLADIGSIAPMLGLFGTVLGMIKSFTVVASDIVASRPMMLAEGVAEALITTAAGLFVGIPAMAAYAFFRGRVQGMVSDLEAASTILMAQLAAGLQPKDPKP
jgi:biopolymer transport protein ExbB